MPPNTAVVVDPQIVQAAVAVAATAFCSPGKRQRFEAGTTTVVHPDVEGIQDIARRLCRGERVAVPTECTYEVLQQYNNNRQPSSSMMMMQQQQQQQYSGSSFASAAAPHGTTSIPMAKPHIFVSDVAVLDTCNFWKHVLVKKSYAIRQSANISSSSTAESSRCSSVGSIASPIKSSSSRATTTTTTATCTTTTATTTNTTTIATFNESVQVVRRIAGKVWPGPVIVYVQVQQPIPGLTVTVNNASKKGYGGGSSSFKNNNNHNEQQQCYYYTSESTVQHYLALRKPCHPLTVKVCREFYSKQQQQQQQLRKCSSSTPPTSPKLAPQQLSSSPPAATSAPLRVASCGSLSTTRTASSSSLSAMNNNSMMTTTMMPTNILVGSPMMERGRRPSLDGCGPHPHPGDASYTSCTKEYYITAAEQAMASLQLSSLPNNNNNNTNNNSVTAVLNGEERREIFAVPTCEHGQPWPVTVWIDADNRTVRLKTIKNAATFVAADAAADAHDNNNQQQRKSPDSVTGSGGVSPQQQQQELLHSALTESALLQSIRGGGGPANKVAAAVAGNNNNAISAKERVLQAVMLKWKVTADHR